MEEIQRVQPKTRLMIPGFISNHVSDSQKKEIADAKDRAKKRQEKLVEMINGLGKDNKTSDLGVWKSAGGVNTFGVNVQQALQPFQNLQEGSNIIGFDIEAVGTPKHMRVEDSLDIFSVTELSFGRNRYSGGKYKPDPVEHIVSMAVAPGEKETKRLKEVIQRLKKNPLVYSEDERRSVLDLVKYANPNNFQKGHFNGKDYVQLLSHHRIPSADSAPTIPVLEEALKGLENLQNATPIEDALAIFKAGVESHNGVLGGYNIHSYDLPALKEAANNSTTKQWLEKEQKKALDTFAAYKVVAKDPYNLTGADLRLQNIHKRMLDSGKLDNPMLPEYIYHFAKHDIIAEAEASGLIASQVKSYLNRGVSDSDYLLSPTQLNTQILTKGDEIFSYQSGNYDPKKHKHNLVSRVLHGEEGKKIAPRWESLNTPLPSNERFKVGDFYHGVQLPDSEQKGYGVELISQDFDGKKVYLFSESVEELQQQIHGSFLPLDKVSSQEFRKLKAEVDQPFEAYGKMFTDGGFRTMSKYYRYLNNENAPSRTAPTEAAAKSDWEKMWREHITKMGGTEELAMKFPHMIERLDAEEPIWSQVIGRLENHKGLKNEQKDMVVQRVKEALDAKGDNKTAVEAKGHKFVPFSFDGGETEYAFNAKNVSNIKSKFSSFINGRMQKEYKGTPGKNYRQARVKELEKMIINQFFGDNEGKAEQIKALSNAMVLEIENTNKIDTALTSISNIVRDEVERVGSGTLVREVTHSVTSGRTKAVQELLQELPNTIENGIEIASALTSSNKAIKKNTKLGDFLREQDRIIKALFDRNYGMGSDPEKIRYAKDQAARYKDLVEGIISQYQPHFDVSIDFREDNNAPFLILDKKGSNANRNATRSYEQLKKSNNTAVIPLPFYQQKGNEIMVQYEGQLKIPVVNFGRSEKGTKYVSTSVTDALTGIKNQAGKPLEHLMMEDAAGVGGNLIKSLQGKAIRAARSSVDPVAGQSNRHLSYDDQKQFEEKSPMGNLSRGTRTNMSGYAKDWYEEYAHVVGLTKNKIESRSKAAQIEKRAKEKGVSFYEEMGQRAQALSRTSEYGLNRVLHNETGIYTTAQGSNNRIVGKGGALTPSGDSRNFVGLGALIGDHGENITKITNTKPLYMDKVSQVFEEAGVSVEDRLNPSLVSDEFHALYNNPDNQIKNYIQMRTAYMDDEELSFVLQDKKKVAEAKQELEKLKESGKITPKEFREYINFMENGGLSTAEGMAIIDSELLKSFDGWEEFRIKAGGPNVELHKGIEEAILEHAAKEGIDADVAKQWKTKGIAFKNPLELSQELIGQLRNQDGTYTLGKYTLDGLTTDIIEHDRISKDKKLAIMGFSVERGIEDARLVMARERRAGQGTKTLTLDGNRATVQPLPKSVMSILSGMDNTEYIRSFLSEEKKSHNSALNFLQGIDQDIRDRYARGETIGGFDSKEKALAEYYLDLEKRLGIKTTLKDDGRYVIDHDWGFNKEGELLNFEKYMQVRDHWNKELGNQRHVATNMVALHDVFDDHGREGALRYGIRDVNMLERGMIRAGVIEPGGQSHYIDFLMGSIKENAKKTAPFDIIRAFSKKQSGKWVPSAGDAVIDLTAEGLSVLGDIGAEKGQDGVIRVSKDVFESIPQAEKSGQVLTIKDYNRTMLNAAAVPVGLKDGDKTVVANLKDHLGENGTIYLKMHDGMEHQYIPLVDTDRWSAEGVKDQQVFLDDVQTKIKGIISNHEKLNNATVTERATSDIVGSLKDDYVSRIDSGVTDYEELLAAKLTSKDGVGEYMSAHFKNSTRLQGTGVNPLEAYKQDTLGKWVTNGLYEESTVYVSPKTLSTQIQGIESQIAQAWDIDPTNIEGDLNEYLVKNWGKEPNYNALATFNRNPHIASQTMQIVKVGVDESLSPGQVRAMPGTSERLNLDFDGDVTGISLDHYSIEDDKRRNLVLGELNQRHAQEKIRNVDRAQSIMDDFKGDFIKGLKEATSGVGGVTDTQISSIADRFFSHEGLHHDPSKLTLGKMHGDDVIDFVQNVVRNKEKEYDNWGYSKWGDRTQVGAEETARTAQRGAVFSAVGSADNVRMQLQDAFEARSRGLYQLFGKTEGPLGYSLETYHRENAIVEDVLREMSQKNISAKKTAPGKSAEDINHLFDLIGSLRDVKNEDDLWGLVDRVMDRGLYSGYSKNDKVPLEWSGVRYEHTPRQLAYEGFSLLKEMAEDHASIFDTNASLKNMASGGMAVSETTHMLGSGQVIPTQTNMVMAQLANETGNDLLLTSQENYLDRIAKLRESRLSNQNDRLNDSGMVSDIINNKAVSQPKILSNDAVAIQRTIKDGMQDTFSDIATKTKHTFNGSAAGMMGMAGLSFAGLWATNALMKGAPTPEGLQEMAPVNPDVMTQPTARVTPNQSGEYINISVSAKTAKSMNTSDLAAMLNNEIMAMSNISMKTHVNVNDNSANIDQRFVEGAVANAMTKGYAY